MVPPWVTPTQWPPQHSASLSHPSIKSTRRWGGAGRGLWDGGSAAADGDGTQVPKGCQQGGHQRGLRAIPPVEAGQPPERGCRAIAPVEGLMRASWSAGHDTATPWGTRWGVTATIQRPRPWPSS